MEQLGLPIGPRAKLLAAISTLTSSSVSVPDKKPEQEAKSGTPLEQGFPQRRQITVMFCDLVNSTELASRLDVEDFRSLLQAYQRACGLVITRYGGRVSQYRGDGIEVYFGWPIAQEDAAERAVCAGLEVIEAVKTIGGPEALAARVGIGTGMVVIGEAEKGDPSKRSRAVGATPHVAARLQAIAAPNSVVIAEATSRLISGQFQSARFGTAKSRGYRGAHACVSGSAHTAKPKSLPGRPWRIDALGWAAHGAGLAATALARCKGWRRACSVCFGRTRGREITDCL